MTYTLSIHALVLYSLLDFHESSGILPFSADTVSSSESLMTKAQNYLFSSPHYFHLPFKGSGKGDTKEDASNTATTATGDADHGQSKSDWQLHYNLLQLHFSNVYKTYMEKVQLSEDYKHHIIALVYPPSVSSVEQDRKEGEENEDITSSLESDKILFDPYNQTITNEHDIQKGENISKREEIKAMNEENEQEDEQEDDDEDKQEDDEDIKDKENKENKEQEEKQEEQEEASLMAQAHKEWTKEEITQANVAGFLHILDVNEEEGLLTVACPTSLPTVEEYSLQSNHKASLIVRQGEGEQEQLFVLPSHIGILGSVKYNPA